MKPSTIWIAAVLLGLGVCGILDAAGVVDSAQTIGQWWPLAIIGWAVADMIGDGRVTFWGVVCAAIGVTLLADTQEWASDAVVWSVLAIAIGAAILISALRSGDKRNGDTPAVHGEA